MSECNHTKCPDGYCDWHEWAKEMSKTHYQTACNECGSLSTWKKKQQISPLKQKRHELGLSLEKASKLIGCTKPHLHEIEKGTSNNPTAKILNGFCRVYGLSADHVLRMFE